MKNRRDNFSLKTINTLRQQVASRCSNPDCRVVTCGSSEDKEKSITVGVAAHIAAAAVGGPRYDANMSKEQRKSINNAIWLCQNCSVKIDRDVSRYPVSLLYNWKDIAISKGNLEFGNKLPSNEQVQDTLFQVLTGRSTSFIANSVSNVIQATKASMEQLDPRFNVSIHHDNVTAYRLTPKEDIPLKVNISDIFIKKKIIRQLNNGEPIRIASEDIVISGSKLLENILNEHRGVLVISPSTQKVLCKINIIDKENVITPFYDISGNLLKTKKLFSFEGTCCDGVFKFKLAYSLRDKTTSMVVSINMDKWEGINISNLPYFDNILKVIKLMVVGNNMDISIEKEGDEIYKDIITYPRSLNGKLIEVMTYIKFVRAMSVYLQRDIIFHKNLFVYDAYLFEKMELFIYILKNGGYKEDMKVGKNNIIKFSLSKYNAKNMLDNYSVGSIVNDFCVVSHNDYELIFGENILLPSLKYSFNTMKIKNIYNKNDEVAFELEPTKNTIRVIELVKENYLN